MAFTSQLARSLNDLDRRSGLGDFAGDQLEKILERYLLQVEDSASDEIKTSVLLLDPIRKRLLHGAAPNLPKAYCDAIDGLSIGASAGSCGTAAYVGHAIFVSDIATDPLWKDYRDLALKHDLRSCWSTPILAPSGRVLGTFAMYYPRPARPSPADLALIAAAQKVIDGEYDGVPVDHPRFVRVVQGVGETEVEPEHERHRAEQTHRRPHEGHDTEAVSSPNRVRAAVQG